MTVIEWVLTTLGVYLAVGAVFAAVFVWRGAGRLDANARGASWGFRMLILPGAAALWPILLVAWARPRGPRTDTAIRDTRPHRRVHLIVWAVLPLLVTAMVLWAWAAGADPTAVAP